MLNDQPYRLCMRFKDCNIEKTDKPFFNSIFRIIEGIQPIYAYGTGFDGETQILNFGLNTHDALNKVVEEISDLLKNKKKQFGTVDVDLSKTRATGLKKAISIRVSTPV